MNTYFALECVMWVDTAEGQSLIKEISRSVVVEIAPMDKKNKRGKCYVPQSL
jgi:hypothetical protein